MFKLLTLAETTPLDLDGFIAMATKILGFLKTCVGTLVEIMTSHWLIALPFCLTLVGMGFVALRFFIPRFVRR